LRNDSNRSIRLYSPIERKLAYEWIDKWFELSLLIIEVTGTDEPPWSPPPPTELDELNYQRLRFWLVNHEEQFVPLWKNFYEHQEWAVSRDDDVADLSDADDCIQNPFSCCYKPHNLYHLAQELDLQSGTKLWEPSEHRAGIARAIINHMGKRVVEFCDWLDEQVADYEKET